MIATTNFRLGAGLLLAAVCSLAAAETEMTVYRSPTCSCCGKWIEHMQQAGYKVRTVLSDDLQSVKTRLGIPEDLASCHTANVDGYVVEGHVPAEDVGRLLQQRPAVAGIAAPDMPLGSPGMEMGGRKQSYRVMAFDKSGGQTVFAEHPGN